MAWLVFSYSLPSKRASTQRVTLWRRLQQLGAVTPKAGVYVLPDRDDCLEAFQWLSQEVQQAQGEALIMRVERFEGLADCQLMDLFRQACRARYGTIEAEVTKMETLLDRPRRSPTRTDLLDKLRRLQKRLNEVAQVDFFDSPEGVSVSAQLRRIQQGLLQGTSRVPDVPSQDPRAYRNVRWVTRPRPHVDRLACAWLIRRFLNPEAVIRYAAQPAPGEVPFDMREGQFGHRGNFCSFEVMVEAFGLKDSALMPIAEIVHEVDLRDGRYARPEAVGVDVLLKGWLLEGVSDQVLERRGIDLFEGLYQAFSRRPRFAGR